MYQEQQNNKMKKLETIESVEEPLDENIFYTVPAHVVIPKPKRASIFAIFSRFFLFIVLPFWTPGKDVDEAIKGKTTRLTLIGLFSGLLIAGTFVQVFSDITMAIDKSLMRDQLNHDAAIVDDIYDTLEMILEEMRDFYVYSNRSYDDLQLVSANNMRNLDTVPAPFHLLIL